MYHTSYKQLGTEVGEIDVLREIGWTLPLTQTNGPNAHPQACVQHTDRLSREPRPYVVNSITIYKKMFNQKNYFLAY